MALSEDGRTLYPVLEGPVTGDDRRCGACTRSTFAAARYPASFREYRVADPRYLVSDLTALDGSRLIALERDNFQGTAARAQARLRRRPRGAATSRKRDGGRPARPRRPGADLAPRRGPGDIGLGDPFAMPYVTIEAVLPIGGDRLAIVNDTNFGSTRAQPGAAGLQRLRRDRGAGPERGR